MRCEESKGILARTLTAPVGAKAKLWRGNPALSDFLAELPVRIGLPGFFSPIPILFWLLLDTSENKLETPIRLVFLRIGLSVGQTALHHAYFVTPS